MTINSKSDKELEKQNDVAAVDYLLFKNMVSSIVI